MHYRYIALLLHCIPVTLRYRYAALHYQPNSTDPAFNFAFAYRRRLRARNALTCFTSCATWCDSIGSLQPDEMGAAELRLARFNLVHRYAVFGLVERGDESQALIA